MPRDRDSFESSDGVPDAGGSSTENAGRPWLGVRFACAGAYVRVYRDKDGKAYNARCPRCGKAIVFRVGPGGNNQRFYEVSC